MERRRTDRVKLTIPLRVRGLVGDQSFECEARTIDLNRHGARIRMERVLSGAEIIQMVNLANRREAYFRVAGPVSAPTPDGAAYGVLGPISSETPKTRAYGVECVDPNQNFWGITFPRAAEGEPPDSKALLECRKCKTVSFLGLSLVEVDVLESSGILSWPCGACGTSTPWGYAEQEALTGFGTAAEPGSPVEDLNFRKHRRLSLQLPVLVRNFSGHSEITKSANVSKGGLCFVSEENYHIGERILVACPYKAEGENIEVDAEIVRQEPIEGTNRKTYGIRYRSREG